MFGQRVNRVEKLSTIFILFENRIFNGEWKLQVEQFDPVGQHTKKIY